MKPSFNAFVMNSWSSSYLLEKKVIFKYSVGYIMKVISYRFLFWWVFEYNFLVLIITNFTVNESRYKQCGVIALFFTGQNLLQKVLGKDKYWHNQLRKVFCAFQSVKIYWKK